MSYQVLARKYRPRNFETLVGQEHVVRALTHALEHKRLHHAYLFTGTRGVGKTTLSRILAKSLNCIGPDGNGDVTAHPCGVCEACVAIDAGRFVDYIEMDAASNRGVDEMAQLLEQAVYAPSNARYKVYMIDEVHMLTNHAFNSMLKTLEEPPEHVKFILATTDPQKIPVTVLSRCLQFNLKQMPVGHIVGHLENILGQEQIEFEIPALRLIAQGAHGSMRDGLSLTDQAIAYAAGKVTLDAVQGMLGALDQSYLIRLLDNLAATDALGMIAVADEMASRSLSYSVALQDLGALLHHIALAQTAPSALPDDLPEREDVLRLAAMFDLQEVQLFYQIVVHGRNELGLAPDEYAGFSMTLLRMHAFRPSSSSMQQDGAKTPKAAAPSKAGNTNTSMQKQSLTESASKSTLVPAVTVASAASTSVSAPAAAPLSPARAALEAARTRASSAPRESNRPAAATLPSTSAPALQPQRANEPIHVPRMRPDTAAEASFQTAPPAFESAMENAIAADSATTAPALSVMPNADAEPINHSGVIEDWPALAASLPLRGVVQQLAQQSELIEARDDERGIHCHLRVPPALETLLSAGSVEKLAAALSNNFGKPVMIHTEIGAVSQTAHAHHQAVAGGAPARSRGNHSKRSVRADDDARLRRQNRINSSGLTFTTMNKGAAT